MGKSPVVDADGHILEPPDTWERYLEPKYRDRAIRIGTDQNGLEYVEIDRAVSKVFHGGGLGGFGGAYQDLGELYSDPKLPYWEVARRTPGAI
jgi:hypothetical protein